ncbi:MAG TPA: acyl-ACP--UDP-N-acetylglucosamine O-acyltransferase [Candidatus Angelobacter sp.]|nr:acyl-ACP--UDP-N-acetylglucosamine O-acyltransferase [Candidatus Angelobacter sp.]
MIHPTAIIHPRAQVDPTASVGPFALIDEHVIVGARCRVGPQVHLTGHTTVGVNNVFHTGCVIGDAPQDLKYRGEATRLLIGDDNVFREHVTIHRSNKEGEATIIGSHNYLMAHCHVGHNSRVGDHTIIANGALLGGHVQVQDRTFISGNCLVHQFVRVGTLALMQGGSAISKDLPPFCVARGDNGICGLNFVGLRRAGLPADQRLELKRLYHALFRSGKKLSTALAAARKEFRGESARVLMEFVTAARRGICADSGRAAEVDEAVD